ncbi:FAD-dependent oxidoreductase [Legionella sp. km772]|uniref:FAD-dependent oxidoreductase n=1 Tax=Legionella sp. km772 TaxID=2498111 RepID=UPI000F8D9D56|nr:FAD-dependent oxidoreductase [Legionella sp. km772]RUR11342.1 FAD-dependent oxidoreductase [Legionella sp. km772]
MSITIGIVGAGLCGRLTALHCLARGWKVSLFDADSHLGHNSCGWVGAGMLAPYTELESSELLIFKLGLSALELWPSLLKQLCKPVAFSQHGTLLLNHPQDKGERDRLLAIIEFKLRQAHLPALNSIAEFIPNTALHNFVPGLNSNVQDGYWLRDEGHLNSHEFYKATTATLLAHGINWHELTPVEQLNDYQIVAQGKTHYFDLVFDCRGLGAKPDWPQLRGVRGEVLILHAPEVHLNCPIRIMHPRYPIYISPRAGNTFIVGATSIESEDKSPISAQSMLELLSACYMVHPGFAEARILHTMTQCRPTLSDNQPRIIASEGLIRLNGLYRHGYLVGPALLDEAMRYLEHGKKAMHHPELVDELKENLAWL